MQFETFKARRITLRETNEEDFEEYRKQLRGYHATKENKVNVIENNEDYLYIVIETEDGRTVGLIQVSKISETAAEVKASIPNFAWKERYGNEAIHQLMKCFKERKTFERVYLNRNNEITSSYMRERQERFEKTNCIEIITAVGLEKKEQSA